MQWLIQIITKYWLEVLFGGIIAIIGSRYKKIKAWWKEIQDKEEEEKKQERIEEIKTCVNELRPMLAEIAKQSTEGDASLRAEMNTLATQVQILKGGILTIQGESFKAKCRRFLENMDRGEHITFEAFESLRHDHNAYNALGGNSNGDELFELVKHRYENQQAEK